MLIEKEEKVHVIYRRLLNNEVRRHFIGEVKVAIESVVRVEGFFSVFDTTTNKYKKRAEKRTTIIDLSESGYIVNVLPDFVNIEDLQYELNHDKKLVLTDGDNFSLNIN